MATESEGPIAKATELTGTNEEKRDLPRATVRANQPRHGASPAQIFHSYCQINHDLSAGCTVVWGIDRINDATFDLAASAARLSSFRKFIVVPIRCDFASAVYIIFASRAS